MKRILPMAGVLLLAAAPCAQAAPLPPSAQPSATSHLSIDASGPRAAVAQPSAIEAAVLPQRSVDRRLGGKGLVGSAGFLCGRQAGVDLAGAASAAGYDPHGRFLGAKLSLAF